MTSRIRDTESEAPVEHVPAFPDGSDPEAVRSLDDALLAFDEMTRRRALTGMGELAYYCDLADKLMSTGRVELALDVLAPTVERAVRACWQGARLPAELVDRLGRSLVRLAHESLDAFWFDAVVALHLASRRPLQKDTAQHLSWLRTEGSMGDPALIEAYRRQLRAGMVTMTPDDRERSEHVLRLLPPLGGARH